MNGPTPAEMLSGTRIAHLAAALESAAAGDTSSEAAVGLVVLHGYWLPVWLQASDRPELRWLSNGPWPGSLIGPGGRIDWAATSDYLADRADDPDASGLLLLAGEIAGTDTSQDSNRLLTGCRPGTARMVIEAIRWAAELTDAPSASSWTGPLRRPQWLDTGELLPTICLGCVQTIPIRHYHAHHLRCDNPPGHQLSPAATSGEVRS